MIKKLFFVFILGLSLFTVETFGRKKEGAVNFWKIEISIQELLKEIRETKDDSFAVKKHLQIEEILAETLVHPSAYKYKFDTLSFIGKFYAPYRKFRIFNWNHSFRDGTHRHFALIVLPGEKKAANKVIRLTDMSDSITVRPDQQILGADKWFGTLYYKIISKRKGKDRKDYYTLLGLDMNNLETKKKIIEILSFDKNGNPQFGAPVIELNKWPKSRVIFEFSASHSMYMEYNRFRRRIEFDHLAPLMPYLVGEYEYYEPDLYRDALKFKNGQWKHYKDVRERPKDKIVKERNLPTPRKDRSLINSMKAQQKEEKRILKEAKKNLKKEKANKSKNVPEDL
jgi:hypothetical protein